MKYNIASMVGALFFALLTGESLAQRDQHDLVTVLAKKLQSDSMSDRRTALDLIERTYLNSDAPAYSEMLAALAKLLNDPDPSIQVVAPRALRRLSDSIYHHRKARLLELLHDEEMCHTAAFTLMQMKDDAADVLPELVELSHRRPGSRGAFQLHVSSFAKTLSEQALRDFTSHRDAGVRAVAANALRSRFGSLLSRDMAT